MLKPQTLKTPIVVKPFFLKCFRQQWIDVIKCLHCPVGSCGQAGCRRSSKENHVLTLFHVGVLNSWGVGRPLSVSFLFRNSGISEYHSQAGSTRGVRGWRQILRNFHPSLVQGLKKNSINTFFVTFVPSNKYQRQIHLTGYKQLLALF